MCQTSDFRVGSKRFFLNHKWEKKIQIQKQKNGSIKSKIFDLNLVKFGTDPTQYKVIQKHQLDIQSLAFGEKKNLELTYMISKKR